jgi:hypothetical protein
MKRLVNQVAFATLVTLATLITAEAASARTLYQAAPQAHHDSDGSDALYSRMIAPGG